MTAPVDYSPDFWLQVLNSSAVSGIVTGLVAIFVGSRTSAAAERRRQAEQEAIERRHRTEKRVESAARALAQLDQLVDAMRPGREAGTVDLDEGYLEENQLVVSAARATALVADKRPRDAASAAMDCVRAYANLKRVGLSSRFRSVVEVQHLLIRRAQRILRAAAHDEEGAADDYAFIEECVREVALLRVQRAKLEEGKA